MGAQVFLSSSGAASLAVGKGCGAMAVANHPRIRLVRRSTLCAAAALFAIRQACRAGHESAAAFVGARWREGSAYVGDRSALRAYGPINRRDPDSMTKVGLALQANLRTWKRVRNLPESDSEDLKKKAYLEKLGLAGKLKDKKDIPPWHGSSMAAGEVYQGSFVHPDVEGSNRLDIILKVNSPTEGTMTSDKGAWESEVKIFQDFPITHEKGEQRNRDMAAYIFCKFNMKWRNFEAGMPTEEELQYLSLEGLRLWFMQAVGAESVFPPEEEFQQNCANPEKGMTMDEFIRYTCSDDPTYIDQTFETAYGGRRVLLKDNQFTFDGDFVKEASGAIFGLVAVEGVKSGNFELTLRGRSTS